MKKRQTFPSPDRVERFVAAIDTYEPNKLADHEDLFRVFARFISRSVDGRYLERHPPHELLPDVEELMHTMLRRPQSDVQVVLRSLGDERVRRHVLMTCMPDQRFIYSIVRMGLDALGLKTYRTFNGIVPVTRDAQGLLSGVGAPDAQRESFIFIEVDGDDLAERKAKIERYIHGRLDAVRTVVEDFSATSELVHGLAGRFEALAKRAHDHRDAYESSARLLRWLLTDHFVFLGTRFLPLSAKPGHPRPTGPRNLGIGCYDDWRGMAIETAEQDVLEAGALPPFLWFRKSRTESWMYRPGRTDHLLVQCYDPAGEPSGLMVIEGLFSFPALAEPRTSVPMLDRVIEALYAQLKAVEGSHRWRTIRNAFNSLPLEYLFALPTEDVHRLVEQVLEVDTDHRLQVHISCDELQSIAFVFVALPRSHYSDELRSDIRRLLKKRFGASSVDDGVYAGNFESVTFHFFLTGMTALDREGETALIADIEHLASPWVERLGDELNRMHGKAPARSLYSRYHEAFPSRYREETSVARAAEDISLLEGLGDARRFDCDIYREKSDKPMGVARLRMFQAQSLLLSDVLPILDNFGLIVIDQFPTSVHVPNVDDRLINTFRISGVVGMSLDLTTRRSRLRNAINAVVLGAMSNDPLNRLLLRADIAWPQVVLVSAYASYARQIGLRYDQSTIQEALLGHADVVRSLTEMFRAKFDPDLDGLSAEIVDDKRLQQLERTRRAVLVQLDAVEDLTSDQVLRTLYNLIEATVRTNFYARDPQVDHQLVLKFDPLLITRMPDPRPYREIFVFHPEVAGLHLRGGPVARGGIRWSDRLVDFRTEVLGLAATQNLKNVLIVPRGAKGAFILRNPPVDVTTRRAHADTMYKVFIGGLLDVTDNLVDGAPLTPKGVLVYDGPDHYLVVAADKGTAHLSDTANALALARGFWLGDAFASGGSRGYDHKKEAITSRGAWACVRRHFRELGHDPQVDPIRVVGIGDMSGDVFGNGLLRSQSMQLIAAFDHRNIFVDPAPNVARAYAARQALFALPRSSWEDYPRDTLSAGGGVFPRSAKAIALTPQMQVALSCDAAVLSGPELVQAILRAPVDLLWNGGIGTYIKAASESHLEVGDPANDHVRVDAGEVRCKVLGEGGNLGVTSLGRVELAGVGVRLNTDAVDNSAGVDMSDHEVNLKILFQRACERSTMDPEERDALMEGLREHVGEHCVENNWLQSRMLSLDELRSRRDSARFQRTIAFLGERVPFKRRAAHLPGDRTTRGRAQRGEGLYRPELAFIAANAKADLREELRRASEAFPLDSLKEYLLDYFSATLRPRFVAEVEHHPLGGDIARMMLTNKIIGDAGASWLPETTIMTGRSTADILHAYFAAQALLDSRTLKRRIDEAEAGLPASTEYALRLQVEDAIETVCSWLLRREAPVNVGFYQTFSEAQANVGALLPLDKAEAKLPDASPPTVTATALLAAEVEALRYTDDVLDVALLASETTTAVPRAARAYFLAGQQGGLYPIVRQALDSQSGEDLDRPARVSLRTQLRLHLLALARHLLDTEPDLEKLSPAGHASLDSLAREMAPLNEGERPLCNLVMAVERVRRRLDRLPALTDAP